MTIDSRVFAPVFSLLVGTGLLLLGNGMLLTLTPLRADLQEFGAIWIGWIGAFYSAGFVVGCFLVPPFLSRVGHIRVFAALAALGSSVPLLQAILVDAASWILLRALFGFCIAGLYMVVESWLNAVSDRETRGTVFAAYMIVNLVAIGGGQFIILAGDPAGPLLFSVVAILIAFGLIPVTLTRAAAPPPPESPRPRLRRLYQLSPVGFVGCLLVGVANGSLWSLGAVYARDIGLSYAGIVAFITAALVGGALIQWPLGRLSDAMKDRRVLMAWMCGAAVAGSVVLVFGKSLPVLGLLAAGFVFGGMVFSLYGLCVAHANDHADPAEFVDVSAALLLVFGVGATVGPVLASAVMQLVGDVYLFGFTAVMYAALCGYIVYRMRAREPVAAVEREPFVVTTRTSPELFGLDPRSEETPGE